MIRTTAPSNSSNSVAAVFGQHSGAEKAVKELKDGGFDVKKLSIIGSDYHSEENVVGFYNTGDRMMYWGKTGAFWGGLWGLLFGSAFFLIPGLGPIIVAGPVVSWIIAALEGAALVGGVSALGAGLFSLGIPKDSVLKYEASVKAGKFLLIAHGTPNEVQHARDILHNSGAEQIDIHQPAAEPALVA
ncbi:MAG: general stress protein [Terriglobales bacterium]|jgi:hypothetical protein